MIFLDATFLTKKCQNCLHFLPKTSVFLGKFPKNGCAHFVHIFTPLRRGHFCLLSCYSGGRKKWYILGKKGSKTVYFFVIFNKFWHFFHKFYKLALRATRKHRRFIGGVRRVRPPFRGVPGGVGALGVPGSPGSPGGVRNPRGFREGGGGGTPRGLDSGPPNPPRIAGGVRNRGGEDPLSI